MLTGEGVSSPWMEGLPDVAAVALGPRSTIGDVVEAALADGCNQLLRFGRGALSGGDPEDVHRARVATRRMRSQLKSLAAAVDGTWLEQTRSDLGWLADGLGAVRDIDVMLERVRRFAAGLAPADEEGAHSLVARLEASRSGASLCLRSVMESPRCRALADRLHAAACGPPLTEAGSEKARPLAPTLMSRSWTQLERSVTGLAPRPSDGDLHEVRIRTKRCRYTAEMLVPVVGPSARRLSRHLADMQGVLGEIHDSHCTQSWLRGSAESTPEALAAGMIIGSESRELCRLLESWPKVWLEARKAYRKAKPKAAPK